VLLAKVIVSNYSDLPSKVTVKSEIQGFSYMAEEDLILEPWRQSELKILPTFEGKAIKGLYELKETSLAVKAIANGRVIMSARIPITLLAGDTIIWEMEHPGGEWKLDLADLVVAWITPHDPSIDTVISSAAKIKGDILGSIGYQKDDSFILSDVEAIYEVLSEDIRYANRPFSFGSNENISTQRILTPRQTLLQKSGNCIDLSVLFASCLESCGILPIIFLIPGHAFVGWRGQSKPYMLEATMLGNSSFHEAMMTGGMQFEQYFFSEEHKANCKIIDVREVRARGVYPVEF
jgi:hypothetical protein